MKKIYTLAAAALLGCTMASAQNVSALKIQNNFYFKTCAVLPEGTHPIVTPTVQEDGTTKDVVTCPEEDKIKDVTNKVGGAYLDADYPTFPISGTVAGGTNYHVLEQDYTDPETGVSFKAGTYSCMNSNSELKFKDDYNKQGLSNIKQVIFYLASAGQLQYYARQYEGNDYENYVNFEGDPTNRKLKAYEAPGMTTPIEGVAQWYEMHFAKPLKVVVDLTNAQGTDDEMTNANLQINKNGENQEVAKSLLQFYEQAKDGDGKIVQGTNLIEWNADRKFVFAFKKKAYVMGMAVICGTEGATYKSIDLSEDAPQWTDGTTGITEVIKNVINPSNRIYSIDGKFVGTDAAVLSNGIYVQNGKKFVK